MAASEWLEGPTVAMALVHIGDIPIFHDPKKGLRVLTDMEKELQRHGYVHQVAYPLPQIALSEDGDSATAGPAVAMRGVVPPDGRIAPSNFTTSGGMAPPAALTPLPATMAHNIVEEID